MKRLLVNFAHWIKSLFAAKKKPTPVTQEKETDVLTDELEGKVIYDPMYSKVKISQEQLLQPAFVEIREEQFSAPAVLEIPDVRKFSKGKKKFLIKGKIYMLTEKQKLYYDIIHLGTQDRGKISNQKLLRTFYVIKHPNMLESEMDILTQKAPGGSHITALAKLLSCKLIVKVDHRNYKTA